MWAWVQISTVWNGRRRGLEDISKLPAITECLVQRGYSDEDILKILGGNFLRVFEQVWGGGFFIKPCIEENP